MIFEKAFDLNELQSASNDLPEKLDTPQQEVVFIQLDVYNVLLIFVLIFFFVTLLRKGSFK